VRRAARNAGLTVLALPVVHHLTVLACRIALVAVEHGLPDVEEREHVAASITYLCSPALSGDDLRCGRT
jgi:hypothetical protein